MILFFFIFFFLHNFFGIFSWADWLKVVFFAHWCGSQQKLSGICKNYSGYSIIFNNNQQFCGIFSWADLLEVAFCCLPTRVEVNESLGWKLLVRFHGTILLFIVIDNVNELCNQISQSCPLPHHPWFQDVCILKDN